MIKIYPITLSNPVQRILTGICLTLLIYFVITRDNSLLFTMFLILVASLAAYEWAETVGVSRFVSRFIYSLTTALVTIFLISITNHQISLVLAGFGLVYIFLCCFILLIEERGSQIKSGGHSSGPAHFMELHAASKQHLTTVLVNISSCKGAKDIINRYR